MLSLPVLATFFLGTATAAAIASSNRANGHCQEFDIPVTASAPGAVFDIPPVTDDISTTYYAIQQDTRDHNPLPIKNITLSGTYSIHAQLCTSTIAKRKNILQIATHGAHYDHRYWDSTYEPKKHSYVYAALSAGYDILTYDRLGAGQSTHPDAYTGVQLALELEILRKLTSKAHSGTLLPSSPPSRPTAVVHIGHSLGSILTSTFIGTYPNESAAGIITGFVLNPFFSAHITSWDLEYAATASPPYQRPEGYVVSSKSGIQTTFFGGDPKTAYTPALLEYGNKIKSPLAVAETASGGQIIGRPDQGFKGPIQYMLAEFDFAVCGGDCKGITNETALRGLWPKAKQVELHIQPNSGHGLPLHNNATAGFQVSLDFLAKNGL